MYLTFLLLCLCVDGRLLNDDFDATLSDHEYNPHIGINKKKSQERVYNALCQNTKWYCNQLCRWRDEDSTCEVSSKTETCFGRPVDYDFSLDTIHRPFPNHLRLLENFPGCWELLNPLICGVYFRPCTVKKFAENASDVRVPRRLWQIYPYDFCFGAQQKCGFLMNAGLWPDELNCSTQTSSLKPNETRKSKTRNGRALFDDSGQCKISYNNIPSLDSPGCMSPLIELNDDFKLVDKTQPLIDRCYIPCDSTLVDQKNQLPTFRSLIFLFSLLMATCFFMASIYFWCFLQEYGDDFLAFTIKMMFTFLSVFYFIWLLLLGNRSHQSTCNSSPTMPNVYVRRVIDTDTVNWCLFQWSLFDILLIGSFEWLAILIYRLCAKPKFGIFEYFEPKVSTNASCFRIFLVTIVCVTATLITCVLQMLVRSELTDGLTNVCYSLFEPIGSNIYFYAFVLFLSVFSCACLWPMFKNYWKSKHENRSHLDRQHRKALLNEHDVEQATTNKRSVRFENPDKDNNFALYWSLFIVFGFLFSIIFMLLLHYTFKYNPVYEKSAIEEKISCILDHIKRSSKTKGSSNGSIPDFCFVDKIQVFDLIHLFLYAFFLPILPFLFILVTFIVGIFKKDYAIWQVYKAMINMQLNDEDEEEEKEPPTKRENTNVTAPSMVSAPFTYPLCAKKKKHKAKLRPKRALHEDSRSINLDERKMHYRQNYIPPHVGKNAAETNSPYICPTMEQLQQQFNPEQVKMWTEIMQLALNYDQMSTNALQQQTDSNDQPNAGIAQLNEEADDEMENSDDFDSDETCAEDSDQTEDDEDDDDEASGSSMSTTQSSLFEEHEDEDYPRFSTVVHEINKYVQNNEVGCKINFVQSALEQFRNLFEVDKKFRKASVHNPTPKRSSKSGSSHSGQQSFGHSARSPKTYH